MAPSVPVQRAMKCSHEILWFIPHVPGLRSCYTKVDRLVNFGRMLDKIRLHATGGLPADYQANFGEGKLLMLNGRCCRFLGIRYPDLRGRTLTGGTDEELLAWAHAHGTPRTDEECHIWNRFIVKLGWRDERSSYGVLFLRSSRNFRSITSLSRKPCLKRSINSALANGTRTPSTSSHSMNCAASA